jgi:hypothetical protein
MAKYSTTKSIKTNPSILSPLLSYRLFSQETKHFTSVMAGSLHSKELKAQQEKALEASRGTAGEVSR